MPENVTTVADFSGFFIPLSDKWVPFRRNILLPFTLKMAVLCF